VKEVVDALKRVQNEADRAARTSGGGVRILNGAMRELKSLLPTIGAAAAVAGMVALGRQALNTADEIGKIAERAGSTAERVSVLNTVFNSADLTLGDVDSTLSRLTQTLGQLRDGSQAQVDTFAKLGLSARDFIGLDTVQAFDLISRRMALLENSTAKTDVALDIFGKTGAGLIQVLNKLGTEGFDAATEAAQRTGQIVDTELAQAAAQVNDSFTAIRAQAQGLATQFIAGLLPTIQEVMTGFQRETGDKGVGSMRDFGRETGRYLRTIIATFRLFWNIVGGILNAVGEHIGALGATIAAVMRGDFAEAGRIARDSFARDFENIKGIGKQVAEDFKNVVDQALREDADPIPLPVKPEIDEDAAREAAERLARINAEIAGREAAKRAKAQAEKEAKERAAAEKKAAEELFDLEQRLLQLRGQGREAQIRALDQEIAKYREAFEAAGRLTDEIENKLGQFRESSISRIDFEDAVSRAQAQLQDLALARERIEQDVELGITSQRTGQERILELERERLGVLRQLADQAQRAAEATGDPALIQQARELNNQVNEVAISVSRLSDGWAEIREEAREGSTSALAQELKDVATGAQSASASLKDLGDAIIETLANIASQRIAEDIAGLFFGSGTSAAGGSNAGWIAQLFSIFAGGFKKGGLIKGYAEGGSIDATPGGLLSGPGTPTSDSLLARVSTDEFVVRAAAVRRPGVLPLLRAINSQGLTTAQIQSALAARAGVMPSFAMGGLVGASERTGFPSMSGAPIEINQVIQAPNRETGRQTAQQAATAAARSLASAQRRNG